MLRILMTPLLAALAILTLAAAPASATPNFPPTANAGGPYTFTLGDPLLALSGTAADPDGDPLIESWRINGILVVTGANLLSPVITAAQLAVAGVTSPGTWSVMLVATDTFGAFSSNTTVLSVFEAPPIVAVPIPGALALLGLGLFGIGGLRRKMKAA